MDSVLRPVPSDPQEYARRRGRKRRSVSSDIKEALNRRAAKSVKVSRADFANLLGSSQVTRVMSLFAVAVCL